VQPFAEVTLGFAVTKQLVLSTKSYTLVEQEHRFCDTKQVVLSIQSTFPPF
jgi:hypothetical protein